MRPEKRHRSTKQFFSSCFPPCSLTRRVWGDQRDVLRHKLEERCTSFHSLLLCGLQVGDHSSSPEAALWPLCVSPFLSFSPFDLCWSALLLPACLVSRGEGITLSQESPKKSMKEKKQMEQQQLLHHVYTSKSILHFGQFPFKNEQLQRCIRLLSVLSRMKNVVLLPSVYLRKRRTACERNGSNRKRNQTPAAAYGCDIKRDHGPMIMETNREDASTDVTDLHIALLI